MASRSIGSRAIQTRPSSWSAGGPPALQELGRVWIAREPIEREAIEAGIGRERNAKTGGLRGGAARCATHCGRLPTRIRRGEAALNGAPSKSPKALPIERPE